MLGLGNMVLWEKMGLGFRPAGSAGGRWNESWQDFLLSGSGHDMQIADWEGCYGVAAINFQGEYPRTVRQNGTEWWSWDYWCRMGVVPIPETQFSTLLPFRDPDKSASQASSTYISPLTNPTEHNARSGWDIHQCHVRDDIWNLFQTAEHVALGKCESHPWGSELQFWWAGKPVEYPHCFIW